MPAYADLEIATKQREFDALVRGGASMDQRAKFLEDSFIAKNRKIRIRDYDQMNPATISSDYLRPRKDLSQFVLGNWARHIFVAGLKDTVAKKLFMFGIGRMFSSYNDIGVQANTDADVNLIVDDELPASAVKYLHGKLVDFSSAMRERFALVVEMNKAFTILREGEVLRKIAGSDGVSNGSSKLFYKANAHSLYIIQDHSRIRDSIFSRVERLPNEYLFEYFLGLGSAKPTFAKIRMDKEPLTIVPDGSDEPIKVRNVIGSLAFGRYCRAAFPRELFVPPPDWIFSMKYFVNRVYDYVCAMRNMDYRLKDIGFDTDLRTDPDFLLVQNAHRMMLFLQELIQLNSSGFGESADYSFMSRSRFLRFSELRGDKFRRDFEDLVLGGELLQPSNKSKYTALRAKVDAKARDRVFSLREGAFESLPKGLDYEIVDRNETGVKVLVPYSWADLGYFAFSVIAARIAHIVEEHLYPAFAASARRRP